MVSNKFSEKKMFFYLRYRDGYTQVNAAKARFKQLYKEKSLGEKEKKRVLKRLQEEAGYYARKLVDDGFLREKKYRYKGKIRSGNPKTYVTTSFTPSNMESLSSSNMELSHRVCEVPDEIGVENKYDWRNDVDVDILEKNIEVHHLCYKFPVLGEPKREIGWDKVNDKMNGITQSYIHWKGKDDMQTTIRYDEYPNKDNQVVVWLPSTVIPAGQHDNSMEILDDYAWKASAWLQRVMQCRLGIPELYRRPHYTTEIREPEVKKAIEEGMTFKNGEVHMDNSDPKVGPCFESEDFEKTKCYSELPDRMVRVEEFLKKFTKEFREMRLDERLRAQEETMMKVLFSLDQLVQGQEKLVENQQEFQNGIKKILDIRDKKDKRKSKESDNRMFG